ncbi:MAG: hypothetical protein HYV75_09080 [Opitutae bacterium]|nr:hypothetical protein [Opitutae bacterium]
MPSQVRCPLPLPRYSWYVTALLAVIFHASAWAQPGGALPVYRWTTLAGRASLGGEDGPAADARFNSPHGLAVDLPGNL